MDMSGSGSLQAGFSGAMAASVIKDTTGAQLIEKTLSKLHPAGGGGNDSAGIQLRLSASQEAGIGLKLDMKV